MYESFGFSHSASGAQSIKLFIPDNTVDPNQFSDSDQTVNVQFSQNGTWTDLLNGNAAYDVANYQLANFAVQSNWAVFSTLADESQKLLDSHLLIKPSSCSHSTNRSIQWSVGMFCCRIPKPWPPFAYM